MRRTFQEVLRCVDSNNLSEECFDYLRYKCEGAINILQLSVHVYNIPATFIDQAGDVLRTLENAWEEVQQGGYSNTTQLDNIFTGSPGRPAFNIPKEVLEMFVENKFTISAMARMLEVSQSTIKRRLHCYGMSISSEYADLTEEALDGIVLQILEQFPKTGYKCMIGYLSSRGFRVQEKLVRESMRRVDPQGVIERSISLNIVQRRRYSVPCPMLLWHIDGHHKLIRCHLP